MSTLLRQTNIDKIDIKSRDIVNGFIRISQTVLFSANSSFYVIPNLVSYIILSYYYETDEFNPDLCGKNITISN